MGVEGHLSCFEKDIKPFWLSTDMCMLLLCGDAEDYELSQFSTLSKLDFSPLILAVPEDPGDGHPTPLEGLLSLFIEVEKMIVSSEVSLDDICLMTTDYGYWVHEFQDEIKAIIKYLKVAKKVGTQKVQFNIS